MSQNFGALTLAANIQEKLSICFLATMALTPSFIFGLAPNMSNNHIHGFSDRKPMDVNNQSGARLLQN